MGEVRPAVAVAGPLGRNAPCRLGASCMLTHPRVPWRGVLRGTCSHDVVLPPPLRSYQSPYPRGSAQEILSDMLSIERLSQGQPCGLSTSDRILTSYGIDFSATLLRKEFLNTCRKRNAFCDCSSELPMDSSCRAPRPPGGRQTRGRSGGGRPAWEAMAAPNGCMPCGRMHWCLSKPFLFPCVWDFMRL
jgi:hypothetical protein